MKRSMTVNQYFSMFNSGKFNPELENFNVSCADDITKMERMEANVHFNPDNKARLKSSIDSFDNKKDITKVKTQVL